MIVTVEEAEKKECPFTMVNCFPGAPDWKCQAGACMAWRWATTAGGRTAGGRVVDYTRGYCGLAGKPAKESQ